MLIRLSGVRRAELGVLFVGEKRIRLLNRRYRGIDRPTDVLSFPQFEGLKEIKEQQKKAPSAGIPLGDIVICPSVAMKNAARYSTTLKEEIRRLLVHGFLHLLGYDHERGPNEARKMRRKEAELLDALAEMD
jgi:probable rRNA maturation factor